MIRVGTLNFYFGRIYLVWFLIFLAGLAGIVFLFEVAELLRRSADSQQAGLGVVVRMGLYKLPETIEHILPFVVLFSGMFTFWRLTRSYELVVARAAGVSAWQFLRPALAVTVLFAVFNVFVINPVGAVLNGKYQNMEMQYLRRAQTLTLTGTGLWLRQVGGDRRYLLHADHVALNPLTLGPLMVMIYDRDNHYLGRIDAQQAILREGYWEMGNVWRNDDQKMPEHEDHARLETTLTLEKIQESMSPPDTVSFWALPDFIASLKAIGLPAVRHEMQWQRLLSQPFLLCAMTVFAAAFSLRLSRRGGVLGVIVWGVVTGGVIFMLNNVVTALGTTQILPVVLAAWSIPVAALVLGNAVLLYLEDG